MLNLETPKQTDFITNKAGVFYWKIIKLLVKLI